MKDDQRQRANARQTLSDRITQQISKQHLEPRSRMSIVIEQVGYASLVLVSFVFVVLVVNWIGFWLKSSGLGEFVYYGPDGIQALVESLPIVAILLAIVGFTGVMKALNHYDVSYKHPLVMIGGVIIISALATGVWLAQTGINEELAERTDRDELPVLKPVYGGKLTFILHSTRAIVGPVLNLESEKLTIGVPKTSVDVETNTETAYPIGKPNIGDRVRIIVIRKAGNVPVARVILLSPPHSQLTPSVPTVSN